MPLYYVYNHSLGANLPLASFDISEIPLVFTVENSASFGHTNRINIFPLTIVSASIESYGNIEALFDCFWKLPLAPCEPVFFLLFLNGYLAENTRLNYSVEVSTKKTKVLLLRLSQER